MSYGSEPAIGPTIIIRKSTASLRTLPPASDVTFKGVFAWSPVSSATITAALGVDPGAWNVWRNRRITPSPMPETWFRRASGSPLIYRVDHVLSWLAARRGEALDAPTTWRLSLLRDLDTDVSDPEEVRKLAHLYARCAGPVVGDVRFTPTGFQAYLASLLSS